MTGTPTPAPTVGRVVHFTGDDGSGPYAAIVTAIITDWDEHGAPEPGCVALATLGPRSLYFQPRAYFDPDSKPGTWRYPPRA